jgi:hypothetical protein
MKVKWEGVVQSLIVALLLAILGAAFQTYTEVKMLRHDVNRIEGIIDNLIDQ